jgi:DNA-binding Lrp family transcriptional regulator
MAKAKAQATRKSAGAAKTGPGVKAYVLIETAAGKTKAVKKGFATIRPSATAVVRLDAVTGPFDFIAVVEGASLDAVGRLVTDVIGTIDGVTRTTTCVAVTIA